VRKQLAKLECEHASEVELTKLLLRIRGASDFFCKQNRQDQIRFMRCVKIVEIALGLKNPLSDLQYKVNNDGKKRLEGWCAVGLVQVFSHAPPRVTVNLSAKVMRNKLVDEQLEEVLSTLSQLPKDDVNGKRSPQEWIVSKATVPIWDKDAEIPVGAFRAYAKPCYESGETKPYQLSTYHWGGYDSKEGYLLRPKYPGPMQLPNGVDIKHFEYMGFGAAGYDSEEQHDICCEKSAKLRKPQAGKRQNAPLGWLEIFLKVGKELAPGELDSLDVYLNFHLDHGDARADMPQLSQITREFISDLMQEQVLNRRELV